VSTCRDTNEGADNSTDEAESDLPRLEPVGRVESQIDVGRDRDQEADGDGLHERSPKNRRQADEAEGADDEL